VAEILAVLQQQARAGDVQAARELRAWLEKYPPEEDTLDLDAMPIEKVRAMLHWVEEQMRERGLLAD
jgi:hypothetical protein